MDPMLDEVLMTFLLRIINQLCDLEQRSNGLAEAEGFRRGINKMKRTFEDLGLSYENPIGQKFNETRTDVEAHISGSATDDLRIVEVMKPVIRYGRDGIFRVIQKGVVVVESRKESV